jgi:hypothetical protein
MKWYPQTSKQVSNNSELWNLLILNPLGISPMLIQWLHFSRGLAKFAVHAINANHSGLVI